MRATVIFLAAFLGAWIGGSIVAVAKLTSAEVD